MPPPSFVYKKGTTQFLHALERGEIQLSSTLSPPPMKSTLSVDQPFLTNVTAFNDDKVFEESPHYSSPTSAMTDGQTLGQTTEQSTTPLTHKADKMSFYVSSVPSPLVHDAEKHDVKAFVVSQTQEDSSFNDDKDESQAQTVSTFLRSESSSLVTRKRKVSSVGDATTAVRIEKTRFKDIIGHSAVKVRCDELLLPMWLPPTVTDAVLSGVRSMPASILLFGPPGCGKTQLARALAGEAQAAFLPVAPSDVYSKFVGVSRC
jgi:SpoVK/Ycf46/Vps4 family AAA+-type ATPase